MPSERTAGSSCFRSDPDIDIITGGPSPSINLDADTGDDCTGTSSWSPSQWLLDTNYHQFDHKQKKAHRTALDENVDENWLLGNSVFKGWRENEKERVLWCSGDPGSGKTTIASIAINHLLARYVEGRDMACLYLYFDYADSINLSHSDLLSSLLAQLIRNRAHVSGNTRPPRDASYSSITPKAYSNKELSTLLKIEIERRFRVFIVVDGLDQCSDKPTRTALLATLHDLPKNTHLLITSCDTGDLGKIIKPSVVFPVIASDKDLRKYLENQMGTLDGLKRWTQPGRKYSWSQIVDMIVTKSEGMFRLARLHAQSLASKPTLAQFEHSLENLANTLDTFYDKALKQISTQDQFRSSLADTILAWLIFAARPITVPELRHAVSIEKGDRVLSDGGVVTEMELTSVCAGLVVIDRSTAVVRLVHYSVEVYLRHRDSVCRNADSTIAKTCLEYLCLRQLEWHPRNPGETSKRKKEFPLLCYAADYWGRHIQMGVEGAVYHLAWQFLSNCARLRSICRAMSNEHVNQSTCISWLHVAVYFGIINLTNKVASKQNDLLLICMDHLTGTGETPLHWAVIYKRPEFVQLLISIGAKLNVPDTGKQRTALHLAVMTGDLSVVNVLLPSPRLVDVDTKDKLGWTPLLYAAKSGRYRIVKGLLAKGANIDMSDPHGWTPLRHAAVQGHGRLVEALIDSGASLETANADRLSDKWSFLHWLAQEGRYRLLHSLTKRQVDLNVRDDRGWSALRWAIAYGHSVTVWHLIEGGANIHLEDEDGMRPLHHAVDRWDCCPDKSLIWLLLHRGPNIHARTNIGYTALHLAAKQGHCEVAWLLLSRGSHVDDEDIEGNTSLHLASKNGHSPMIALLLGNKADIQKRNRKGFSALHLAAIEGHSLATKSLLGNNAKVDAQTKHGFSPLHLAAKEGKLETVEILLGSNADIRQVDNNRQTALHLAVIGNQPEVVKQLLTFCDQRSVEACDDQERTPLHTAACEGHLTLVKLLLEQGASRDAEDSQGLTPLGLAERYERKETVTYFGRCIPASTTHVII